MLSHWWNYVYEIEKYFNIYTMSTNNSSEENTQEIKEETSKSTQKTTINEELDLSKTNENKIRTHKLPRFRLHKFIVCVI